MPPPAIHLRDWSGRTALRWAIDRMRGALRAPRPGGDPMAQDLAPVVLLQALRPHLEGEATKEAGWFLALADDRLGRAIRAMHADPARRWSVAEALGYGSESASSAAVKRGLGSPPRRWRDGEAASGATARRGEPNWGRRPCGARRKGPPPAGVAGCAAAPTRPRPFRPRPAANCSPRRRSAGDRRCPSR